MFYQSSPFCSCFERIRLLQRIRLNQNYPTRHYTAKNPQFLEKNNGVSVLIWTPPGWLAGVQLCLDHPPVRLDMGEYDTKCFQRP